MFIENKICKLTPEKLSGNQLQEGNVEENMIFRNLHLIKRISFHFIFLQPQDIN